MHEALRPSKVLVVWFDGCQDFVVHRPLAAALSQAVEDLFFQHRVAETVTMQGPVALRVLLALPGFHEGLQQRGFSSGNAALEMLRLVLSVSSKTYKMKGIGLDAVLQVKAPTPYLPCQNDIASPLPALVNAPALQ